MFVKHERQDLGRPTDTHHDEQFQIKEEVPGTWNYSNHDFGLFFIFLEHVSHKKNHNQPKSQN